MAVEVVLLNVANAETGKLNRWLAVEGARVREGQPLSGSLRVSKMTKNSKQISLYTIGPGECCPLTTSSLM